jgi:uncharacterized protein (DUF488 family)
MCSERDPLECHRMLLTARELEKEGALVDHIRPGSRVEPHREAIERVMTKFGLTQADLFRSHGERETEALHRQEELIAFTRPDRDVSGCEPVMVYTIGFTKKSARAFFGLLRDSSAKRVVDVRLNNVSQLAGFAKRDDLAYFLEQICGIEYLHLPVLAPTQELLDDYKKRGGDWARYESGFLELMRQRRIEKVLSREQIASSCLLCSEDSPHHCHRRLVAEYLQQAWGAFELEHLQGPTAHP